MKKSVRPNIPPALAQFLRKEACFGCAKCGVPIIEFHHIVPWEKEHHFRPEDMIALCPNCHYEVGFWEENEQRHLKRTPYNLKAGLTNGGLFIKHRALELNLGKNLVRSVSKVLAYDDETLLAISKGEKGRLELSVNLYNINDELIAKIENNYWIIDSNSAWDFEFKLNYLKLREKQGAVSLMIDAREYPVVIAGKFFRKGKCFWATTEKLKSCFDSEVTIKNCAFGGIHYDSLKNSIGIWPTEY